MNISRNRNLRYGLFESEINRDPPRHNPERHAMMTKRRFLSGACAGGLASVVSAISQQARPQTIRNTARVLVGSPPGGSTDAVARLLTSEMKGYAPTIIVENRPGAGNRIAL